MRQCDISLLAADLTFPSMDSTTSRITATLQVVVGEFRIAGQSCPLPDVQGVAQEDNCPVDYDGALYESDANGSRGALIQKTLKNSGTTERPSAPVASSRTIGPDGAVVAAGPTRHFFLVEVYPSVAVESSFKATAAVCGVTSP